MGDHLKLQEITPEGFPQWKLMRNSLYNGLDDTFHDEEMQKILNDPIWYCFFICLENNNIGFVELSLRNIVDGSLNSPVPYIEGIYLIASYRGRGLGSKTIRQLYKWCMSKGYSEMAADTELKNAKGQNFFKAMGFSETYRTVGFRIDLT